MIVPSNLFIKLNENKSYVRYMTSFKGILIILQQNNILFHKNTFLFDNFLQNRTHNVHKTEQSFEQTEQFGLFYDKNTLKWNCVPCTWLHLVKFNGKIEWNE